VQIAEYLVMYILSVYW